MFFLREGGVCLGLVVEGEGGRLGLAPSRQASTPCPHPHAETAELWMQFSLQPGSFMNWCKNLLDLDSSLTTCVVSKWPYRDHEAAPEDTYTKGVEGYVGPCWPR